MTQLSPLAGQDALALPARGKILCAAILLIALSGICNVAQAASATPSLSTYTQLENALNAGKSVHVALDFSRCTVAGSQQAGPSLKGGMQIGSFLIPDGKFIAFSDVHQTLDSQNHPVTEYIRYEVRPDGQVSIRSAILQTSADTASLRGTYICTIGHGANFIE